MRLRLADFTDRLRSSLFFVPTAYVVAGILLGEAGLVLDSHLGATPNLPFGLTSTVASARSVLSTIAGATITVAGIAFSVSLLIIQLASSQYSPRVVTGLFRDPFNKRVMGIVVGTFTYCLVVLRSAHSPLQEGGASVVPNVSVAVAVVFGIVSVLAIVAFIDHNAHTMDVSEILEVVTDESAASIRRTWSAEQAEAARDTTPPEGESMVVSFTRRGWVRHVDVQALLHVAPPGGFVRLDTTAGRYAIPGTPLCTVWPVPDDPDAVRRSARGAVQLGASRTMSQDVGYGLRQLADVALKALSPGINDPTTAQDAVFHAGALLRELQTLVAPPRLHEDDEGRRLLLAQEPTPAQLVDLAFGEVRRAAVSQPTVCVYLLETMRLLVAAGERGTDPAWRESLLAEARLVVEGAEAADLLPRDLETVHEAYAKRFGAH